MTKPTRPPRPTKPAAEPQPALTVEAAQSLADRLMQNTNIGKVPAVPKKVPNADDIDGQTRAVGAALGDALDTATDVPLTVLKSVVADVAAQLVALGIRQTEHVDPEAIHAPAWIVQGMREQSMKVPEQPRPDAPPAAARTAKAPVVPKKRLSAARAVRR